MTVSYIDRSTLAVLAPSVTKALDISDTAYGWLTSAFSVAYLIATPLAGWWIDRAGARRGLVASVLVWSTVAALHAVAPGFGLLLALRIALGVAEGPSFPGAAQTVHRVIPPRERARGFGVLFTGSSIGGMIVPPLASWLYGLAGWRVAFLGSAAFGLLWIPLWIAVTRPPDVRAQLDTPPDAGPARPRPAFRDIVGHPIIVRGLVAIFATAPVIGFVQAWGSKYLAKTFDVGQADVGHFLWLPPLVFDLGAIGFGDLASRQRRAAGAPPRALFAIGLVLCAVIAVLPYATSPWESMVILAAAMAGGGALYTLVTSDMLSRMPSESVSLAGGVLAGAQSLALIVANPLIGWSVERLGDYRVVAIALGGWVIPGCLIWLIWRPPERYRAGERASG